MTTATFETSGNMLHTTLSHPGTFTTMAHDTGAERRVSSSNEGQYAPTTLMIRKLPRNMTNEGVRTMLLFAKDLQDTELVSNEYQEDHGFVTALARFSNSTSASEAQSMLDGKPNSAGQANMVVDIVSNSVAGPGRRNTMEPTITRSINQPISPPPTHTKSSRFNGTFQSIEKLSPPPIGSPVDQSLSETNSHIQDIFSPQSPNQLQERSRISGKSMIGEDVGDDETGELLRDPVAYMKNDNPGYHTGVRQMNHMRLPVSAFNALSLNTNLNAQSTSAYASPRSAAHPQIPNGTFSPGGGPPFQNSGNQYIRLQYPPVNPADQNPPCNTLYVGNLPMDTSEDELKAMFSKQRGYKRLCFRTKQNGPMCFVEFEDVSFATKALHELYGVQLHNSVKGGIRLSFSKNPLGVRSGQAGGGNTSVPLSPGSSTMNGMSPMSPSSFSAVNGPPPGLSAPPGLNMSGGMAPGMSNGQYINQTFPISSPLPPGSRGMSAGNGSIDQHGRNGFPGYMMGR